MPNEPKEPSPSGNIVIVPLTGVLAIASAGNVGHVTDGIDHATGDRTIKVSAVDGACSTARQTEAGTVSLDVAGAGSIGRPNEWRVIGTLRERLQADGSIVLDRAGVDRRGEDGLLIIDGQDYVLQVVTAPSLSTFWRQAKVRVEMSDIAEEGAVEWIRTAMQAKARKVAPRDRKRMVLALDAQHAGVLASDRVIASYLKNYGTPKAEFGFAAVWVVGPTASRCRSVG